MFRLLLLFITVQETVVSADCPLSYNTIGDKCMKIIPTGPSQQREDTCEQDHATLGKIQDKKSLEKFAEYLKEEAPKYLLPTYWIGIRRKNSIAWQYEADGEEFSEDSYGLWAEKPEIYNECAAVSLEKGFDVVATSCQEKMPFICIKTSGPCRADYLPFIYSDGICIGVALESKNYYNARDSTCFEGSLMPLKDNSDKQKMLPAIHTAYYRGAIFIPIQKSGSKKWKYADGKPVPNEWYEGDPQNEDCAGFRITHDWSIKLHTVFCGNAMSFICERHGMSIKNKDQKSSSCSGFSH